MSELLIETRKISKSFGGVKAVRDVTFSLKAGNIIGLIGPNGAGKTTLVNLLTGVLTPDTGEIIYKGDNVTSQRPFQACLCRLQARLDAVDGQSAELLSRLYIFLLVGLQVPE